MKYLTSEGLKYFTEKLKSIFAKSSHKHTTADISNFPTSLPANGGNADTVDGKHVSDLQNYNNLTNKPISMKNPYSLTMQFNGTTQKTYDGSLAQTLNITPSGIGAAAGSHTHENQFFSNNGNLGVPIIDANKIPLLSDINKSCCLYILNGTGTCSDAPASTSGYCITITGNGNRKQLYLNWADTVVYQRLKAGNNQYTAWTKINDGGNADTVDGYHAYQFQNYGSNGTPEGTYLKSQYDGSKGKFYIKAYDKDSGNYLTGVFVDYAANSDMFQDKDSSYFMAYRGYIDDVTVDFNTLLDAGLYNIALGSFDSTYNQPEHPNGSPVYSWGQLITFRTKSYSACQMYISHNGEIVYRCTYNAQEGNKVSFREWKALLTSETLSYSEIEPNSIAEGCAVMLTE